MRQYSGLIWPAHVDKPSNSLYSILGCWPEDLDMDAVELYYDTEPAGIPESVHRRAAQTRTGSGISRADIRSRSRAPISPD